MSTIYFCGHVDGIDCGGGQRATYDLATLDKSVAEAHANKWKGSWSTDGFYREMPCAELEQLCAEVARLRHEVERFANIRDLLVMSLARATGTDEESIRCRPLDIAIKHSAEVARLREKINEVVKNLERDHELTFGFVNQTIAECIKILRAALAGKETTP